MARAFSFEKLTADLPHLSDDALRRRRDWATGMEHQSNAPGMGRNPKARRMYRRVRQAAEEELDRRGLLWGD